MSKRFVKNRYPEAICFKTNGWIKGNPYIIRKEPGGSILKGKGNTEKEAWANLKLIILENEKAKRGLTEEEIKKRNEKLVKDYYNSKKGKATLRKMERVNNGTYIDEGFLYAYQNVDEITNFNG